MHGHTNVKLIHAYAQTLDMNVYTEVLNMFREFLQIE